MTITKFNIKSLLAVGVPLVLTISLTFFLQKTLINDPDFLKTWLSSFGVYTLLAYIIVQAATIIIAPIGGLAAAIAVIAIFGPVWGNIIIYLVTTPLYVINFLIAKRFGKRVVKKLVGEAGLQTVDKYSTKLTPTILIFMKLFLGGYFDFISYAAGFTKISLKSFIIINIFFALPFLLFSILVFTFSPNFTTAVVISFVVTPAVIGISYLPFHGKVKKYLQAKDLITQEV